MFWGHFLAAPSSYIKRVRAVYKQRIYYCLIQFSGMLHCWLQIYHARIRTLGSSLVAAFSLRREHSAILSTFIKLPFVIKIFILSIFEWPF